MECSYIFSPYSVETLHATSLQEMSNYLDMILLANLYGI